MKKWEDEQRGEKSKKGLLMMGWIKEHKLATAGIVLALVLLSGIGAYGATSLYQAIAGKNVSGDSDRISGELHRTGEEDGEGVSGSSVAEATQEPGLQEANASKESNGEANSSDSENIAANGGNSHQGKKPSPTPLVTPSALPTASPKATPKPTPAATPEREATGSGSGTEQEITVSRGEEKGPNGYSFPVYSEITPINLSNFICVDEETGEKMTLPTDGTAETKKHTMLIYLCGSDLISQIPQDLSGLISSNFDSDEVNVLVLLGGNV